MNVDVTDVLILFSSILSVVATVFMFREVRQNTQSFFLNSNLGMLFVSAAIVQWFLFGVSKNHFILILTSGAQIPLLFLLLRKYLLARTD